MRTSNNYDWNNKYAISFNCWRLVLIYCTLSFVLTSFLRNLNLYLFFSNLKQVQIISETKDTCEPLYLVSRRLGIQTYNSKWIFSFGQYCYIWWVLAIFDEKKRRFYFLWSIKLEKHKPLLIFQCLHFTVELL